jgi:hypothetical protein
VGEVSEHEGAEESVFAEEEEIFLVESVDDGFAVFLYDFWFEEDGDPFFGAVGIAF